MMPTPAKYMISNAASATNASNLGADGVIVGAGEADAVRVARIG